MATSVKIPDPVYDRVSREADRQDVPMGVIIRDWMEKAEKYEEMEVRQA